MTDLSQQSAAKERVSTYLYFSSLYFFTVGVLYLWGYWSPFNVNILDYLSLSDIIKSTAFPIVSTFAAFAFGAILGEITLKPLRPGAGRETRIGRFLHKVAPLVVLVYIFGTMALLLLGPVWKWLTLPVLFALPVYLFAKERGYLQSIIPDDGPRSVVIFLLAALPTFAYGHGRIQADEIVQGSKFQYVLSPIGNVDRGKSDNPMQLLRFLGHTNDFVFFLEPNKGTLVIAKLESGQTLVLKDFKRQSK